MKLLITGSTGMVGKNLTEVVKNKFEVIPNSRETLNLENYPQTLEFIRRHKPDLVLHAAGYVGGIQANIQETAKFYYVNTVVGFNLLNACNEVGVSKVLNLGSSCMYPSHFADKISEEYLSFENIEKTNEGYGLAKVSVAKFGLLLNQQGKFQKFKTLIPCNLFGKGDRFDSQRAHLIPAIIRKTFEAVQNGHPGVEIWGDGTARREFMDVTDFAKTVLKLVHRFDELPEILNVGLGYDFSVNEFYQMIAEQLQFKGTFTHNLQRPTGTKRKVLDITKLKKLCDPVDSGIGNNLKTAITYYKETLSKI